MGDEQRYRVLSRIAAGGMAEVYRGESAGIEGFRKKVAIKRVLPKLSQNQQFIDMFLDEARLGAYLSHSRCVQVFDIGQGGGSHFIVMEYVDGADLKEILDYLERHHQAVPVEVACFIAVQICEGLEYAHNAVDHSGRWLKIVHRDISPHNVLMTRYGEVKLVDFGLAKAGSHLTEDEEDIVKGKFGYLAPEVTLGKRPDKRVDIFAAGILLWEMLAGRRLFLGSTDIETFKMVQAAQIPDVREFREDVDEPLVRVVTKALARDPDARYQTAGSLAKDLSRVLFLRRQAVTYHDVGALVERAAAERAARKKGKDDASVAADFMGDLIIEALHSFSGVLDAEEEEASRLGKRNVEAGGGGFVDIESWGFDEEGPGPAAPASEPVAGAAAADELEPVRVPTVPPGRDQTEDSALLDLALEPAPPRSSAAPAAPGEAPGAAPAASGPPPPEPSKPEPAGGSLLPWVIAALATAAAVAGWVM